MKSWIFYGCLCATVAAYGQQSAGKLAFEVASIKPAEPMPMGRMRIGMNTDAGMLRYTNVSLKQCIRVAYRVKDFQVQGPDWLDSQRFDITAKLPEGATEDQVPEMLQELLADRFKMHVHRDTKEHAIYALVAGKGGPKLKPADNPAPPPVTDGAPSGSGAPGGPPAGPGGPRPGRPGRGAMMIQVDGAGAHLKAPSATLAALADMISNFSERPVVDMSGISGQYDFDLVFAPETLRGMPGGRAPTPPPGAGDHSPSNPPAEPAASIYDSVQRYGLKLEPRKAPMEVVFIDSIEKMPTEN